VPLGYVIAAVCTLAALGAPRRPRGVGVAAYFLSMVVNELPQIGVLYLAGSTALALVDDELAGASGGVAIVLAVLTTLALGELARRGIRSRSAVAAALQHAGISVAADAWRSAWSSLFAPFPTRPRAVRRIRNLPYGPHPKHRLDVYRRTDTQGGPVVLYFHGGGYFSGRKHWEGRALLYRLAQRGWVCMSANYRLRPGADFPDHLDDAKRALAWAHEHAADHGADPRRLVMVGSSAGAHLSALCALTQANDSEHGRAGVDAAVCLYGYYGRYYGRGPDESPVSTPLALDAGAAPPFFLAHGDHDTNVPVEYARAMADHLRAESPARVAYAELPGGQHAFDLFQSWRGAAVVDGVEHFLAHEVATSGPVDETWSSSTDARETRER
jgi:acetyl esterase/lipase